MVLIEPVLVGLKQLRANKLRTFLTMLGILIGVGSVVGITSIGEGLRRSVVNEMEGLGGSSLILVQKPQHWYQKDGRWIERAWDDNLTEADGVEIS